MAVKISKNRMDMGSTPIKNVSYLDVDQVATQAAPATGKTRFYSKTDGALYVVPGGGAETAVSSSIPANVVAYFNGAVASIPSGWTEFTAGRGRVIVGVPLSGTVGGTVGTALTNVQNKSTTHTHTGPSHTHTGPSHTHTGPSHQHLSPIQGYLGANTIVFHTTPPYGTGTGLSADWFASSYSPSAQTGKGDLTSSSGTGATGAGGTGATGAGGTGTTGTGAVATGDVMAYIQQPAIVKS